MLQLLAFQVTCKVTLHDSRSMDTLYYVCVEITHLQPVIIHAGCSGYSSASMHTLVGWSVSCCDVVISEKLGIEKTCYAS